MEEDLFITLYVPIGKQGESYRVVDYKTYGDMSLNEATTYLIGNQSDIINLELNSKYPNSTLINNSGSNDIVVVTSIEEILKHDLGTISLKSKNRIDKLDTYFNHSIQPQPLNLEKLKIMTNYITALFAVVVLFIYLAYLSKFLKHYKYFYQEHFYMYQSFGYTWKPYKMFIVLVLVATVVGALTSAFIKVVNPSDLFLLYSLIAIYLTIVVAVSHKNDKWRITEYDKN